MRRLSVGLAALTLALSAGTVLATPSSGITPMDLARGTSAAAYTITHEANREIATQTLVFPAGTWVGWHTHPGPVATIVKSGTLSIWFSSDCTERTVTAGQAIVVPGGTVFDHARNNGTEPLTLVQTYFNVPVGGALRTDAASPSCPAPAPQDMDASATITSTLHSRTRLDAALNLAVAANTDVLIQQLTWAPGGDTGWHSHPGPVTVAIQSGSMNFIHADCTTTDYPAGTAFLDHLTTHHATSAGGNLVFATYMGLPPGGAARIDQPAPACASSPAPAATTIPNTAVEVGGHGGSSTPILIAVGLLAALSVTLYLRRRLAR